MLKAVLVFCQKSAKIMLIFLKSACGLQKVLTFSAIFDHRTLHFSDFHLHFSSTKSSPCGYCWIRSCMLMFFASQFPLVLFFPLIDGRVRCRAISALLGWLPLLLVDDAILERVWWIMDSRRQPLTYQTYSPFLGSFDWNECKMRLWTTYMKLDCAV